MAAPVYAALVHYPVVDKHGALVSTSVTNLDIHDISRSATTYGLAGYFIVTPIEAQHWLVGRILGHWQTGWGATYNENRKDALNIVRLAADVGGVAEQIEARHGLRPLLVTTSARRYPNSVSYEDLRTRLASDQQPVLLLFGTGWGLHPELVHETDLILHPINGPTPYNHLSVRAAAAIIFDRLLGMR
jgi:hypothetical protein